MRVRLRSRRDTRPKPEPAARGFRAGLALRRPSDVFVERACACQRAVRPRPARPAEVLVVRPGRQARAAGGELRGGDDDLEAIGRNAVENHRRVQARSTQRHDPEKTGDLAPIMADLKQQKPRLFHETKLGKIYLGDALDVLALRKPASVDLIMTSPPFGLVRKRNTATSMPTTISTGSGPSPNSFVASSSPAAASSSTSAVPGSPASRRAAFITSSCS